LLTLSARKDPFGALGLEPSVRMGDREAAVTCQAGGSPDGAVSTVPSRTGVPKFGVPSAFQVNFCARVDRFMSQPPEAEVLAW
jgi:hypothetical protein